jgi:hypothetical protein
LMFLATVFSIISSLTWNSNFAAAHFFPLFATSY